MKLLIEIFMVLGWFLETFNYARTIKNYAIDYNNKKQLTKNIEDSFASAANYLKNYCEKNKPCFLK